MVYYIGMDRNKETETPLTIGTQATVRYYLLYSPINQAWFIMLGTGDLDRDFLVGLHNDKLVALDCLKELQNKGKQS
jgi:hypothetical protein